MLVSALINPKRLREPEETRPALVLGYDDRDQFAPAGRLLAEGLPTDRVFTVPGRHDWRTWKRLWEAVLAARCFADATSPRPA